MKKKFVFGFAVLVLALSLAACGKSDNKGGAGNTTDPVTGRTMGSACGATSGVLGSCKYEGVCVDFVAAPQGSDGDSLKQDCEEGDGVFSTGACSSAGLVGSCKVVKEGGVGVIRFYAREGMNADIAKQACAANNAGTFCPN